MHRLKYAELLAALQEAGVQRGDIVHVQSDLRRIGPVDAELSREAVLGFYLSAFQEVLGPQGTLTVLTAFEDYGRYQTPFVREESPSRTDTFSEYVRTRPGAVRSIHPIMSLTGLGARAEEICGGAHYEGLGYDSPWGRLHRAGALIMTLGLGPDLGGTTFFHYVESLYGVPYKYTKIYTTPVYAGGVEVPGPFTLSVRYLDYGIVNTPVRLKWYLLNKGKARNVPVGHAQTWSARCNDIVEEFTDCLRRDRYYLLETPPHFRPGEIPMDGPTGPLQEVYDEGAAGRPA
jgi:aminoglycoside 3-N-acetyltransferase